jgi:hypothetical protein
MGGEYFFGFHDSRCHHRNRPDSKVNCYRVVDEYDSKYILEKEASQQLLTLGELVTLMDTVECIEFESWGLVDHRWDYLAGEGSYELEYCVTFTRVSSDFHPHLAEYNDQKADEWIAERRAWETEDLDASVNECSREI